jgi:hypothetical protein
MNTRPEAPKNASGRIAGTECRTEFMKTNHTKYDIIGDIHGHADALDALLHKLDYEKVNGIWRHPADRKVIFVGDFIDRGPKILDTLKTVRAMTDSGNAFAVLGNHEWNALRYHTCGPDGAPLRPHTAKNEKQHSATLEQIAVPHPEEWNDWLAWFKTVPLYLDLGGVRIVHAAWCKKATATVGERRFADDAFLLAASTEGTSENAAVKTLLNGPETLLPTGIEFTDKEGHAHEDIRARWFGLRHRESVTYRELVFPASEEPPPIEVPAELLAGLSHYAEDEPLVVFGHYWLPPAAPSLLAKNAVCVDYSVASKTGGLLAAYRWDGENEVNLKKFAWVESKPRGIGEAAS